MGKIMFVFPGQGSQYVGMAKDVYEEFQLARELINQAEDILEYKIKDLMFNGPEEELKKTENAQPAVFLHSYVMYRIILTEVGKYPDMVAGHSLGEYTAVSASGAIDFPEALRLVKVRGLAMAKADPKGKGTMSAIIGLPKETVIEICQKVQEEGKYVEPVNFNAPDQIVISGEKEAVYKAMELAKEYGAKRCVELKVSGAFHSKLVKPAAEKLKEELANIIVKNPKCILFSNVTGNVQTGDDIKENLYKQIFSPVLWVDIINNAYNMGADLFVEVGPGNVLQGLIKRILKDKPIEVLTTDKVENLKNVIKILKERM